MSGKLSFKSIAARFSQIPIEGFFDGMSECLALVLDSDCVILSKCCLVCENNFEALSIYHDGQFIPPFTYSILGTPCERIRAGGPISYLGDLEQEYPSAPYITGQNFTHYLGFPLVDCDKKPIGCISVFNRQAIADEDFIFSVLKIASQRAVRELVRYENLIKMERLNRGLRLPSGSGFYQDLVDIIIDHSAIDAVFIGQLFTPIASNMRIRAMSGEGTIAQKYLSTPKLSPQCHTLSHSHNAHQYLPQLRPMVDRDFNAAVIIKLSDHAGDVIGYIGALSYSPLTNTENIVAILESFSTRTVMELELQNRNHKLRYFNEILSATDDLMSFVDHKFHYRALNQAYCRKFGRDIAELLNQPMEYLHGKETFERILKPSIQIALSGRVHTVEIKSKNSQGQQIYIHGRHHPCRDAAGKVIGVVISARDVTELKNVELALADSEERLHTLYNKTPSMFFTVDRDFMIHSVNVFGANKLGYQVDELMNMSLLMLYSNDDRMRIRERLIRCFDNSQQLHEWEIRQQQVDGHSLWVKQTAQVVITPEGGSQIFLASEDISEKHRLSQKLSYQATHDSLTGLSNRLEFDRALRKLVERKSEGQQQVHILCYIDLDKFKLINDSCGHLAGDELLRSIADILTQHVRKSDVLARIGGDEFSILMENCKLDKAREIAESIRVGVKDYVLTWKDKNYQVSASIGLTIFNLQTDSIAQVLSAADEACYAAKAAGRDKVIVFSHSGRDKGLPSAELSSLSALKDSIAQDKFEMHAQPIFIADDLSKVVGYELLLRLRCDDEYLDAGKLLKLAHQHQLMTKVDERVIRHAFLWLAGVAAESEVEYCAINISGTSAGDAEFLEYVLYQLNKYHLSGKNICFEITETAAMSNLVGVTNFMTELRKHGCLFTLDNFGSGLSSFNHMKNLSFDMVKISDEYVAGLSDSAIDRAMVEAVVGICHAMGAISIAGAVENKETYQCLVNIGVDCVQGYYCSKPQPLQTIS